MISLDTVFSLPFPTLNPIMASHSLGLKPNVPDWSPRPSFSSLQPALNITFPYIHSLQARLFNVTPHCMMAMIITASRPCTGSSGPRKTLLSPSTYPNPLSSLRKDGRSEPSSCPIFLRSLGPLSRGWALNGTKWLNARCLVGGARYVLEDATRRPRCVGDRQPVMGSGAKRS